MTCTIHVMTGLPGSGKSTFARELVEKSGGRVRRVNLDEIRFMLDNNDGSKRLDDEHERTVLKTQDAAIVQAVRAGFDVVIDNTHLSLRLPNHYKQLLATYDVEFVVHDFTGVDVDECIRRDGTRNKTVGEAVIRSMHQRARATRVARNRLSAELLNTRPAFVPYEADTSLPTAVMCDIDGTLAHHNGRGPYDAQKCETDLLDAQVARFLHLSRANGDAVVLLSGRSDEFRAHTLRWLAAHDVPFDELWMRAATDRRSDDVVKGGLFDDHVRNRWNVQVVLDDRDRVVNLWRRLGLSCWQVAYGDF